MAWRCATADTSKWTNLFLLRLLPLATIIFYKYFTHVITQSDRIYNEKKPKVWIGFSFPSEFSERKEIQRVKLFRINVSIWGTVHQPLPPLIEKSLLLSVDCCWVRGGVGVQMLRYWQGSTVCKRVGILSKNIYVEVRYTVCKDWFPNYIREHLFVYRFNFIILQQSPLTSWNQSKERYESVQPNHIQSLKSFRKYIY